MPDGQVGGGHQNEYSRQGIIFPDGDRTRRVIKFDKKIRRGVTPDRHQAWTSGTPVEWDDDNVSGRKIRDPRKLRLKTELIEEKGGEYKVHMLVSRDSKGRPTYHPLVQFYNAILASIINDGLVQKLDNLHSRTNALRLWMFLERTYLNVPSSEIRSNLRHVRRK